jgi:hypothetical protein
MGEAKRRREAKRCEFLEHVEKWSFPPSHWEKQLVDELLQLEVHCVPRTSAENLKHMNMQPNRCHENVDWYVKNAPSGYCEAVTGWMTHGNNFVLHSVLIQNDKYLCITPSGDRSQFIDFTPDKNIEWVEKDGKLNARRNGEFVEFGVRRKPDFEIAKNQIIKRRLLAGINPYQAIEVSPDEIEEFGVTIST